MSSNFVEFVDLSAAPVRALVYHDMSGDHAGARSGLTATEREHAEGRSKRAEIELSQEELKRRLEQARLEATRQTEERLRGEYERSIVAERATVASAIAAFVQQRDEYYARAEAEVVQLALAIAAKILHREAQVDPMLVATLVTIAIEKMREGSSVTVRVGSSQMARWKSALAEEPVRVRVELVEDSSLSDYDCILETELGSANFGLDTQLKEVEQGFFDLMALRPVKE